MYKLPCQDMKINFLQRVCRTILLSPSKGLWRPSQRFRCVIRVILWVGKMRCFLTYAGNTSLIIPSWSTKSRTGYHFATCWAIPIISVRNWYPRLLRWCERISESKFSFSPFSLSFSDVLVELDNILDYRRFAIKKSSVTYMYDIMGLKWFGQFHFKSIPSE